MLKFIKNQALANQSIKEMNTDELDPFTLTLLGKSYLYTDQLAKAETLLTRLKTSVSQQHICYTDICRLLGITYFMGKRRNRTESSTGLRKGFVTLFHLFLHAGLLSGSAGQ